MRKEKVITIGIQLPDMTHSEIDFSLEELGRLVNTAGGEVVFSFVQKFFKITPQFLIGKGKLKEIKLYCDTHKVDTIVFDGSLSPAQQKNIENFLGKKTIDRTRLILDIFAKRSSSKEGKLQVELAQLEYMLPRLTGKGIFFSQQTGGIGTKGPGERKLEVDSRRIRDRIIRLKKEINNIKTARNIQRKQRKEIPVISLVGYTNSGKSTLMNRLTNAGVFTEDKLFATLDPTVRRLKLKSGQKVLLTDTVGFIQKLPHQLVASFKATLEEIKYASVILHIIDISIKNYELQIKSVHKVLNEIGAVNIPVIEVYNKIDSLHKEVEKKWLKREDIVAISALTGKGIEKLADEITKLLQIKMVFVRLAIPYEKSEILHYIYEKGIIKSKRYGTKKIYVKAMLDEKTYQELKSKLH